MSNDLRPFTACFTGHREMKHRDIPARLDKLLTELVKQGYKYFGAGGALGFDTLAALSVLRAREKHPNIKLIIVSPFPGQEARWSGEQQERYRKILSQADKVRYTGERYTSDCYHVRNRRLVDGSSLCIAYMYKNSGGTAYTVQYARDNDVRVINMADDDGIGQIKTTCS